MTEQPTAPADPTVDDPTVTDQPTVDPAATQPAPAAAKAAQVGDVVTYQLDDDEPVTTGLVVGQIDGSDNREAQLLVVPLPEAFAVPHDAIKG